MSKNRKDMFFNILIVEDSIEIFDLIELYIENKKFNIIHAIDGIEAICLFNMHEINIIILDIMLPKKNGYEVLKTIRKTSNVPIIILSSKALDHEIIIGLELGADDYITKPFNPLELIARIDVIIRRTYNIEKEDKNKDVIEIDELKLDIKSCLLYKNSIIIEITGTEYKILKYLMSEPMRVFTKAQVFENVWGEDLICNYNIVTVYISRLREKIEDFPKNPRYIKTLKGLGYRFEN